MKKIAVKTKVRKLLADTITPVSIYLKIRDIYPNSLLLESSDYHGNENSYSYICMKPVATFEADNGIFTETYPDGSVTSGKISSGPAMVQELNAFQRSFEISAGSDDSPINGLFGYCSYDSVKYFEKIDITAEQTEERKTPEVHYSFYNYIIAINHFQNVLYIIENIVDDVPGETDRIQSLLFNRNYAIYSFRSDYPEESNMTDEQYKSMVTKGKEHCYRGDVFQIVLSRQFSRKFTGDDFNVYRSLRSVNPSPYLFYFDYGTYKIFGSSPEAHLKILKGKAYINPIAGTFRRTGDDENDKLLAQQLSTDLKENAEHVMLVDLARNDISRYAKNVKVESFREVQFYSHVIHLVSSVSGEMNDNATVAGMMAATFPAGTLSGAPKYKAMQLIDKYEKQNRGFYGGAIGFMDFNGQFNHAILIRTFLSKGNRLHYQAGAGIVAVSDEDKELHEVNNKLGALREAIELATEII